MAYLNTIKAVKILIFVLLICCKSTFCWSETIEKTSNMINPLCWISDCNKNEEKVEHKPFLTVNPKCWFAECEEAEKKQSNPYCWFKGCAENVEELKPRETFMEYYRSTEAIVNKFMCLLRECPTEVPKQQKKDVGFLKNMGNYLNAVKPQKPVIETLFSSEYSPYCWLSECCNKDSIPGDTIKLEQTIDQTLYGQHLTRTIVHAIDAHWNMKIKAGKALVFSFHGSVGVGKNYLTSLIAKTLFKLETKSQYVHLFTGKLNFAFANEKEIYQQNLYNWLKSNITQCPRQLFVFDGVEDIPAGVLDFIKPVLDYRDLVDGADYREAIFIFITNIGAEEIQKQYEKLRRSGKTRQSILSSDFENVIMTEAINHKGGFYNSAENLIDHYIPFLPLEEEQVINCIKLLFSKRDIQNPQEDDINDILKAIPWILSNGIKFSKNGCKGIASKVELSAMKYNKERDQSSEL